MKTVFEDMDCVYEIERSKFYSFIFHIDSEEEFKLKLKEIMKLKPKATHYCYAYAFDNRKKSSDDGEPSGTAGMPILEIINNSGLNNVGLVVVRYFGGIKLGAGGLIRAYAHSANLVCKQAHVQEVLDLPIYELTFDYDLINVIEKELKEVRVLSKAYETKVVYQIATSDDKILDELVDYTNGKIQIKDLGTQKFVCD